MKKSVLILILLVQTSVFFSCSDGGGGSSLPQYQYHTPDEVQAFLSEVNSRYPLITRLAPVGNSVQGRPITAIIISDIDDPANPDLPESESRIRLTGGIHGSEMISVELMIRFIEYLTYNYNKDADVTELVDSRYIVIIPVLNPDGLARKTRFNSKDVDLNRDFWIYYTDGSPGSKILSQPESQAIVSFSQSNIFHLSATFHSGAVLLNMPFDFAKESVEAPDENTLVKSFAKSYTTAGTFLHNPDLSTYALMDQGIINGGDWYVAKGTLQDWSYKETGCLDMTIEVSRRNPSTEAGVQQVFMYNRDSLMAYIKKAGYGVHGQVKDSGDNPVAGVMVGISGGDIVTKTDSEGYYHRILLPGDYTLTFRHSDYNNLDEAVTVPDSADGLTQNVEIIHK